jgi:hypothetical protein
LDRGPDLALATCLTSPKVEDGKSVHRGRKDVAFDVTVLLCRKQLVEFLLIETVSPSVWLPTKGEEKRFAL